jgi:hypothetical protein
MENNWFQSIDTNSPILHGVKLNVEVKDHGLARIPEIFHSLHDGPFTHCRVCHKDLRKLAGYPSLAASYFVVRSFVRDEPITEYAICYNCDHDFWNGISVESRAKIAEEFHQNVDMVARRKRLQRTYPFYSDEWIAQCVMTGKPRHECDSYMVVAMCVEDRLVFGSYPWMRSGESQWHTWRLWSTESRGRWEVFVERYLGPSPPPAMETPIPMDLVLA